MNNEPIPTTDGPGAGSTRRGFLTLLGVGAAGAALAACSNSPAPTTAAAGGSAPPSSGSSTTSTKAMGGSSAPTTAGGSNGDLDTAAFAASLEVLAVGTYGAALDAATAGKLGDVPPAVAEFATTAKSQHQAALDKWNGVLTSAGKPAVTQPPAKLKATVDGEFAKVTDVKGAAGLALMLEQIAAATYLKAIPTLRSKDAIELAGSINVVDAQHVAVLLFVLGMYPVPDVFAKTDKAASPS